MGALQQPTLLNPADPTFEGTKVLVRCIPGEDMPAGDAQKVCRNVANALRQQGADTETVVPRALDDGLPAQAFDGAGADLSVEITSRTEHRYDYPALALAYVVTLSTVPAVEEETYAQDVVVRSRNQGVLASETYRARFVTYTGWLFWSANWLLDLAFRDDDDDLTGDVANKNFSKDFYAQISQLAWNARVRADVLGVTTPKRRAAPRPGSPATEASPSPSPSPSPSVATPPEAATAPLAPVLEPSSVSAPPPEPSPATSSPPATSEGSASPATPTDPTDF